ncbi:MAG TPA: SET domain-containing protein-lysine N-methyltransferase [Pyrinomonadaceae bacterium]|nr:SET domain-containing protein-lysine N-methyltransferase [Pyrinomonadaceae bacterium]
MKLAPGLTIGASRIHGRGCFATARFPKGRKIAEYAGELISGREAARRMRGREVHRVCPLETGRYLDGARGGNGTHYINHSCAPNAYMRLTRGHILFMALRDIRPGEEITLDYETTLHPDTKKCRCNARGCRGTINDPRKS